MEFAAPKGDDDDSQVTLTLGDVADVTPGTVVAEAAGDAAAAAAADSSVSDAAAAEGDDPAAAAASALAVILPPSTAIARQFEQPERVMIGKYKYALEADRSRNHVKGTI